jgi:hypothetical protein
MDEISQFVSDYKNRFIVEKLDKVKEFRESFSRLKTEFAHIKKEAGIRAVSQAPDFNIFYLTGIARDEVRTHSAVLANLLNPNGSHGQGELFLHSFLNYCLNKYPDFPRPPEEVTPGRWSAITEMPTRYGRLDVVIMNPAIGYLCLIENKVDAYEQPRQLQRYWNWMETRYREFPHQALVFLTIKGYEATTAWEFPYYRLSYKQDVPNWLESTVPEIQAPVVKTIVEQYIEVVIRL